LAEDIAELGGRGVLRFMPMAHERIEYRTRNQRCEVDPVRIWHCKIVRPVHDESRDLNVLCEGLTGKLRFNIEKSPENFLWDIVCKVSGPFV
jgi:hypothetical protein